MTRTRRRRSTANRARPRKSSARYGPRRIDVDRRRRFDDFAGKELQRHMLIARGDLWGFIERPISVALTPPS